MATLAQPRLAPDVGDERFFLRGAIVMTLVIVAGFSLQYAMGRSSFHSPLPVHLHAFVFMGWVAIYLTQNLLVATGRMHLHRKLGWIAAFWLIPMVVLGCYLTARMVRAGHAPFFFRPQQFLVFNPLTVLTFAGLTVAAIVNRKRTEWHRRLHFCGMSLLLGPALGRLLPGPLLQPWAFEAIFAAGLLFPVAGMVADLRRSGHIHPAWKWGVATMFASVVLIEAITYSPLGTAYYNAVTSNSPGAAVPGLDFAPPPSGPLMTGR